MVEMRDITNAIEEKLSVSSFKDYCPNGLQVQGSNQVRRVVTAVTASQNIINKAAALKADLLLVHHGYFWKGESETITGMKYQRVKSLLQHDLNLAAYHLPLDAHPELGNNARLGALMGVNDMTFLSPNDNTIGYKGALETVVDAEIFKTKLEVIVQREVIHVDVNQPISTVAWCTGAGQRFIEEAADAGCDAFVSGEISEPTAHIARERGIHYFAAGHHATERYGVQALGEWLAVEFGVEHLFVDEHNPA